MALLVGFWGGVGMLAHTSQEFWALNITFGALFKAGIRNSEGYLAFMVLKIEDRYRAGSD